MFDLAFEEWARRVDEQQEAALHMMDMDREVLSNMSLEEVEVLLQTKIADPTTMTRLEAYYDAHPMAYAQAQAEMMELEDNALSLLERDDAQCLYLSREEMGDWLPVLMERLEPLRAQAQQASEQGEQIDPDILETMQKALVAVTWEMAARIFVPERIAQLAADLKDYRSKLYEAGEREAATYAHGALLSVTREDLPPAENHFLAAVCFASLHAMMHTLAEEGAAPVDA
jgi:hypothetical protein